MKAYRLPHPGFEHLQAVDVPTPEPARGEVLIRLRAAALNYLDLAVANGLYAGARFPLIPVADGAGEIAALGEGVDGWAVGDRVVPHFKPLWTDGPIGPASNDALRGVTRDGSLAEYALASAASIVRTPSHLTDLQAATLPITATTAWNAIRRSGVGPGDTVLLLGTGGVSIFALQFAKAAGARVIVTSSSDEKLARARALGADEGINYRTDADWDAEAMRLTGGRGVELVVEGGGSATFARSLAVTAYGGMVFTIGFLSGTALAFDALPLITKGLRVQGNNTGSVADLAAAARAIEAHRIEPVVDAVFDWDRAADAYAALQAASHVGKIALRIEG